MALNLKDSLEIVKRAGFDSRDKLKTSKTERRMLDGELLPQQDSVDPAFSQVDFHREPEKMTWKQLLDIDEL